ncbi:MAG: T9SS type A sorting domain-containing protein [Prevotellaceae bacterium]|jgi:hypothetical protein|nr:T9SS type A sorting domain-containing protein [Prevotellaceae bacterium]
MKTILKTACLFALLTANLNAVGQTAFTMTLSSITNNTGVDNDIFTSTFSPASPTYATTSGKFTAVGLEHNDGAGRANYKSWAVGDYFYYSITAAEGYNLTVTAINSSQRSSNTGPRNVAVETAIALGGPWTTHVTSNLTNANDNDNNATNLNIAVNAGETLYIRYRCTTTTSANNGTVVSDGTHRLNSGGSIVGTYTVAAPSYSVSATSNNVVLGTVSVNGKVITAAPADACTGYADPAYTVTSGTATVVQEGNVFTVTPTSDCSVQINFVAASPYTVTLNAGSGSLSSGSATWTQSACADELTLPAATACDTWTFAGWTTSSVSEQSDPPTPLYLNGENYRPTANITLYAVYTKVSGSVSESGWDKITDASAITDGIYLIAATYSDKDYFFNGTIASGHGQSVAATSIADSYAVDDIPSGAIEMTFSSTGTAGQYYITNGSNYLRANAKTSGNLDLSTTTTNNKWNASGSAGSFSLICENGANLRSYSGTFRTYDGKTNSVVYLFKKSTPSALYNSNPDCPPEETDIVVDATETTTVEASTVTTLTIRSNDTGTGEVTATGGSVSVTGCIYLEKEFSANKWYFISFPYRVKVSEIQKWNGGAWEYPGAYLNDWEVALYNTQRRATNESATGNWQPVAYDDGYLEVGQGYIFVIAENCTVRFPSATGITLQNSAFNTTLTDYTSTRTWHSNWHLTGQPYFASMSGNNNISGFNYVTIWNAADDTYSDEAIEDVTLKPFTAMFVQHSGSISFTPQLLRPSSVAAAVKSNKYRLELRNASHSDRTQITLSEDGTPDYVVGRDYLKTLTTGSPKPQLYTIDRQNNINLAFNDLYKANEVQVDLGIYAPADGTYTIALTSSDVEAREVLLIDNLTTEPVDLLQGEYIFTASAGTANNRFKILIKRADIGTSANPTDGEQFTVYVQETVLTVKGQPADTHLSLMDVNGRKLFDLPAAAEHFDLSQLARGVYLLYVQTGDTRSIYKVLY